MKLKVSLSVMAFGAVTYLSYQNLEPYNFTYRFMIIANSYSLNDEKKAFDVKEKLIKKYEYLCFGLDESYHKDIVKSHIDDFKFEKNITSYYSKGMIVLKIGNGLGYTIKGNLRKSECDDYVINEKIYFFEIFK